MLLRNFFSYYIKSLMMVNEQLNMSYLAKLKREYMTMREADKITVTEIEETINEMEVDEQSKEQLYQMLTEQTNMRDLQMTDEGSQDHTQTQHPAYKSAAEDESPWEYVFRNEGQLSSTTEAR